MKVPSHKHTGYEERIQELEKEVRLLKDKQKIKPYETIKVYSADDEICLGMHDPKWHKIVCQYEGDRCLGGPRPHWTSFWEFSEQGLSLEAFLDERWKGWNGQYSQSELRYDQINRILLNKHVQFLDNWRKTTFGLWFPCHIYNDITGDLYRP